MFEALGVLVKYLYLLANSALLLVAIYMFEGMSDPENLGGFIFFMSYALLPFAIPLYASFRYFRGISKQATWSIAGVVAGFLACIFYAGAYAYSGPDSQLDLFLTIMPLYQIVGLIMAGGAASFIIRTHILDE